MSLYHETGEILSATAGGSLKSRVFGKKDLKSPQAQVYALALESSKWSEVLKEVIENSEILRHERKLTPILALLLVHDFLISKSGIALPQTHGLRAAIERHKARLTSELTRARLKRKMPTLEALKSQIDTTSDPEGRHPRWIRINTLKTTLEEQLDTTFQEFVRALSVEAVVASPKKHIHIDEHIPNLVALSPGTDVTKSEAYKTGAIILQDKASCFPAYLLNPHAEDGNVIDSCAAPGNKTTHIAAIIYEHLPEPFVPSQTIFAIERDSRRAQTLEKMIKIAGCKDMVRIGFGQDFLELKSNDPRYQRVGALLLDPSCSGSGIVGRDFVPELHLPQIPEASSSGSSKKEAKTESRKRKRDDGKESASQVLVDDDGNEINLSSEQELQKRLESLSAFQLSLVLHAMTFPAARKITYSTCSIHAEENEIVVMNALASNVAKEKGWRILQREKQVRGMREWPVRGTVEACNGETDIADACIRTYKGDGRGVMGFFVAGFERDLDTTDTADVGDGPYLRDEDGAIVRGVDGMPFLKSGAPTGRLAMQMEMEQDASSDDDSDEGSDASSDEDFENGPDGALHDEHDDPNEHSDGGADGEWNGIDDTPDSAVEMPPPGRLGWVKKK